VMAAPSLSDSQNGLYKFNL